MNYLVVEAIASAKIEVRYLLLQQNLHMTSGTVFTNKQSTGTGEFLSRSLNAFLH